LSSGYNFSKSLKKIILLTALLFLSGQNIIAQDRDKLFLLDIAAAPARLAMTRLAEKTNNQLLFPYDLVKGITTNPVRGRFSFRQALALMLKGTPLSISSGKNTPVTVSLSPYPVTAPQQHDSSASPQAMRPLIEEISVTARKRLESIRDVPFSIAAKTSDAIFLSSARNFADLARGVSGLSFADLGPGQSQIAIRGISAGQIFRDQPGVKEQVGIYLDESVISMALFTPDLDFFDFDRVEVLRGPQGTLYGSGSLSGTVRYISNAPDLLETRVITEAGLMMADGGDVAGNLKMAVNLPLAEEKAAVRLVGYYNDLIGYVDALMPKGKIIRNVNDGQKYGGRIALTVTPSEDFTLTPRMVFQNINTNGFPRVDIFNVVANPYTTGRPRVTLKDNQQFIQLREGLNDKFLLADMLAKYRTAGLQLTSISSYINRDITVLRDAGQITSSTLAQPTAFNLTGPVLDLDAPLVDQTNLVKYSQEIRLHSTEKGPFQYVIGAFYTTSNRKYGQTLQVQGFEALTGLGTTRFLDRKDILFFSRYNINFRQWAFFGESTYALTDRLKITGGARWFEFRESRNIKLDGLFPVATDQAGSTAKTVSRGITPRFIIAYKAAENIQLTAQIAKGFRLGGINDPLNRPLCSAEDFKTFGNRQIFKNEELWNYELGLKSSFYDGKVTFDTAFYYADIKNLQATIDAGGCSSRVIFNVPRARSIGIETELFLRPHPDVDISFSASLQDATIRSSLLSRNPAAPDVLSGIRQGNRLPTSPTFQASAQISYYWTVTTGWNGFTALNLQYVGPSFSQIGDQVPGFGTVDLTVTNLGNPDVNIFQFNPRLPGYKSANIKIGLRRDHLELSLFINNLLDETIRTSLDRERGGIARVGYTIGTPRTFGFTLRSDF